MMKTDEPINDFSVDSVKVANDSKSSEVSVKGFSSS
jgi:hypothetical protein